MFGHLRTQKGFLTAWLPGCPHHPSWGLQQSLGMGKPFPWLAAAVEQLSGQLSAPGAAAWMWLNSAVTQPALWLPSEHSCKHQSMLSPKIQNT